MRISYFITPHGFGHAARAAAIIEALHGLAPRIEFELFTQVPEWFFDDSLTCPFIYHALPTDIGLVQETPFAADLAQTLKRLDVFYPLDRENINRLAAMLKEGQSELVVCDIAAMGIVAAQKAGIPCLLVENFTWDWIYEAYAPEHPAFSKHIDYLKSVFARVDYHFQTQPVCRPCRGDLTSSPVSRKPRTPASQTRKNLGLSSGEQIVLVTTGGIPFRFPCLESIKGPRGVFFLVPSAAEIPTIRGNAILLPHRSRFFHPDLVAAADAVVGKTGYSTLAEVYWAGAPFGYVSRWNFRESNPLGTFIDHHMAGMTVPEATLSDGSWILKAHELLSMEHRRPAGVNGADQIAAAILQILG